MVGLIAGVLGKLIMPGDDPGGFIVTILLGIVGAFVGGFVVSIFGSIEVTGFNLWTTLGAVILLAAYQLVARKAAYKRHRNPNYGAAQEEEESK
jgi:uncharacterized membrane protein YeaQ/YmgE (transglycosylase-associated protein family)